MEPSKAAPLQIPSEQDDVPLFDPSGLSASLSVDDWHNSFDLSSVAAARLGIGSPPSQDGSAPLSAAASVSNLTGNYSRNNSKSDTVATSQPKQPPSKSQASTHDAALEPDKLHTASDNDIGKRGRRRRSSAAQDDSQQPLDNVHPAALPQKDTSVGSKVRMWWERSAAHTPDSDTNDSSVVERQPPAAALATLRTDLDPIASSAMPESTSIASPSSLSQEASSPIVRSPAADFLSAFSSLNSVVQPATSYDNRSLSYSPPRSGHRSLASSLMRDETRNGSAAAPGFASLRGLGSAAAELYDAKLTTAPNPPPRLDDEGARVGPSGRYLLGKTIGVGGFSTVREGWDLEAQGPADPTAPMIDGQRKGRRVAVKIIYHDTKHADQARDATKQQHQQHHSQELRIWKSLPTHQHLLPLLHHERVSLDAPLADPSRGSDTTAELLIMPYCDQGNLLDFVRSGGGASPSANSVIFTPNVGQPFSSEHERTASGSWFAPSSARSSTQLSRSSSLRTSMEDPSRRHSGLRTGSGFVLPRNSGSQALGRVASVSAASQLRTIPAGQEASSVASSPASNAGSVSSGSRLLRKTASRTSRSQGVPIDAAREIMRQLISALSTLHNKSHILHGDLKLENVLGQDQSSWKKRQRMSTNGSDPEARSRQDSSGMADSIDSLGAASASSRLTLDTTDVVMPCWRIADFGLAQIMDPVHTKSGTSSAPALIRALKEEASALDNTKIPRYKKLAKSGRGGSLAYTAPEFLQAQGRSGTSSPTTAESAGEDGELPAESPFAADMWALGCILYALMSGTLPFTDSFEPRLQMKIAKAQWELPRRLRRRAERLTYSSTSTLTSQASHSNRNSSVDRSGSVGPTDAADRFAFSQHRSTSGLPRGIGSFGSMDLSASLPSLLPRERQVTESSATALPKRTAAVHSGQVVGSAPGRADHLESFEINEVAKARADMEEDPESDEDSEIDPAWDGLSWDRAAARQVLRGLLEPDPRRRWTVDQLCSSAWIRQEGLEPAASTPPLATTDSDLGLQMVSHASTAKTWTAGLHFDKANVDDHFQRSERGRRSSSLARSRPSQLAFESPASASPSAQSPSVSMDEDESAKRRSRSTSRVSLRYRDTSRNRSTDVSGSSTPNRERDHIWAPHHIAGLVQSQTLPWMQMGAKERCDSPADSERRGRMPRSRMADLDENTTWNGEDEASSDSRAGSGHRIGPIAIRGRSQSRSRSRHSRESTSPERFGHRSISRSRSNYSLSHEAGGGTGILYGRSVEPLPVIAPVMADHAQAQWSSTAHNRSRAPDALTQILDRDRSRSRSRVSSSLETSRLDGMPSRSTPMTKDTDSNPSERDQEARGRARDRR
ncbi:hypothetical protein EX895_003494 [Sporisorium graminicola]|uniref:non-specific serine/threonine protein kinase n=1 Tax=Sporisorium graminicola TaxID=280036 RepID=A0A4U7KSP9_9BASI|nr:hypothetical protein EX895_003494 [Sporisorium graminicola]TKY87480.1 hypothetical protein EX895_003494 [Sporisorium graminicola]